MEGGRDSAAALQCSKAWSYSLHAVHAMSGQLPQHSPQRLTAYVNSGLLERLKRSETERKRYDEAHIGQLDDSTQGQVVGTIMQEYLDTRVQPG